MLTELIKGLQHNLTSEVCDNCLRETGRSSMLNKITNRPYKVRADWVNHFYSQ